eukprot:6129409-Amphidinium_carterae.1
MARAECTALPAFRRSETSVQPAEVGIHGFPEKAGHCNDLVQQSPKSSALPPTAFVNAVTDYCLAPTNPPTVSAP